MYIFTLVVSARILFEGDFSLWVNKNSLSFEDLLKKDETKNIHQRNLQILATEIYKVKHNLVPDIMKDIFISLRSLITWETIHL